ncbi:MAG: FAD-binding oxidoreductase [Chloroflexi bacterium]|nr:FAD-binding oxidoreductase [Chloroflexota bacterium]
MTLAITALAGGTRDLDRAELDAFASTLDGSVLLPDDDGYANAIALWNGMITKRPAVVVAAGSTEDVVRTVAFARDQGVELSVKGGGHNIAGLALSDGGVTLDLSGLREVAVDPEARLARVAPGCTLGDVDRATQAHGMATTLGFVSATGTAGLTLGGGFGYLSRRFGWTVDDLEEAVVVTADGQLHRASRTENEDLFWALRGGGGNFGVVTEFTYRLHEVGPQVTGGVIAWPAERAPEVLEAFRAVSATAPRELTLVALRRNAPPAPWLPESAHGKPMVAIVACHSGSAEQAEADLAPIRALGDPLADIIQVREYVQLQSMLDATQPKGMHFYWKSEFVSELSDDLLDAYHAQFDGLEAPANQIVLFQIAGALNERAEDDGAVGNRDAAYACVMQAMSAPDSPARDANRAWVRAAWEALKPFSTGGNYVNFQTDDEPTERTAESYRRNMARLRSIKARYDPENLFRVNRNIRP